MHILSDYSYNLNINNHIYNQRKTSISFDGGLTKFARKNPLITTESLIEASRKYSRDKGFIGVFPAEFINVIKASSSKNSSSDISKCVEAVKNAFINTSKVFEDFEMQILNNHKHYSEKFGLKDYYEFETTRISLKLAKDRTKALENFDKEKSRFLPDENYIKETELHAARILKEGLVRAKVLSEDSNVKVQRLNEGNFGTAYRVMFTDKNEKKLFKDKVIKYFKDFEAISQCFYNIDLKKHEIIRTHYPEIKQFQEKIFSKHPESNTDYVKAEIKKYKDSIDETLKMSFDEYVIKTKKKFEKFSNFAKEGHEVVRETIVANYLANASGQNLSKSNLIKYHYSDINNNFAVLDFASFDSLGPVTKKVDYDTLGIYPADVRGFSAYYNFVADRLIDYGNFKISSEILATNKVARKIYKKIKHIMGASSEETLSKRKQRFDELKEKAENNRISKAFDVLLGLKEAKKLINLP